MSAHHAPPAHGNHGPAQPALPSKASPWKLCLLLFIGIVAAFSCVAFAFKQAASGGTHSGAGYGWCALLVGAAGIVGMIVTGVNMTTDDARHNTMPLRSGIIAAAIGVVAGIAVGFVCAYFIATGPRYHHADPHNEFGLGRSTISTWQLV